MTPLQRNRPPPSVTPVPSPSALVPQSLGEGLAAASTSSLEGALPSASGPSEASPPAKLEGTTETVALHHTPPVQGEGLAQPPPPLTPPSQSSPVHLQQVSERLSHIHTKEGTPQLPLDTSPLSRPLPLSPPEPPSTLRVVRPSPLFLTPKVSLRLNRPNRRSRRPRRRCGYWHGSRYRRWLRYRHPRRRGRGHLRRPCCRYRRRHLFPRCRQPC